MSKTETVTRRRPRITYHPDLVKRGKAIFDIMPNDEQEFYLNLVRDGSLTLTEVYGCIAMGDAIERGGKRGKRARNVREGMEAIS